MASFSYLVILGLLPLLSGGTLTSRTCEISVKDGQGAQISGAHLLIHRNLGVTPEIPDQTLNADAQGKIEVTLVSDAYDICAMSAGFRPSCQIADLRSHNGKIAFRLKAATEILEN